MARHIATLCMLGIHGNSHIIIPIGKPHRLGPTGCYLRAQHPGQAAHPTKRGALADLREDQDPGVNSFGVTAGFRAGVSIISLTLCLGP